MKSESLPPANTERLKLFSVVIPARDEAESLPATIEHLHLEFSLNQVPHEIVVVDDGSQDRTWEVLQQLQAKVPGLRHIQGDAAVIMMADESDDARDAVRYWKLLNEGWDCVFGSRFIKGGGVIDYPQIKLFVNRLANLFIRIIFRIPLNDTANAFKAYRRTVIQGCEPLIAPHFNLTVEIPLKAIVRGYSWTVVPITWRNRCFGQAKLKIKEMGSRYFFICAYVWLEKYFSRGDYKQRRPS